MGKTTNLYGVIVIASGALSLLSTQMTLFKFTGKDFFDRPYEIPFGIDDVNTLAMALLYLLPIILIILGGLILTGKMLQSTKVWLSIVGGTGLVVYAAILIDRSGTISFGGFLCIASFLIPIIAAFSSLNRNGQV